MLQGTGINVTMVVNLRQLFRKWKVKLHNNFALISIDLRKDYKISINSINNSQMQVFAHGDQDCNVVSHDIVLVFKLSSLLCAFLGYRAMNKLASFVECLETIILRSYH